MTWQATTWRPPQAEKVRVRFREGSESKYEYAPRQLRWTDTGQLFDITHWKHA